MFIQSPFVMAMEFSKVTSGLMYYTLRKPMHQWKMDTMIDQPKKFGMKTKSMIVNFSI